MNQNRDFINHHLKDARIPQALKNSVYKKYYNSTKSRTDLKNHIEKAGQLSEPLMQAIYMPTTREELIDIYAKRQSKEIEQRSEWGETGCAAVVNYLKRTGLKDLFPMRSAENEAINNDGFIFTDGPTIKRLVNDRWLMRQMRKKSFREVEQIALNYGLVNGHTQRYISDAVFKAVQTRKQRNNELLQAITAINEEGDEYTLAELSELSVSNPAVRNTELMVRMRGNDEYALKNNHPADMWTLTAPSKYHPSSHKWNGSTPRETQQYLSKVWARFRAYAKRNNFNIYGFRVAEPHKDGCPHWHMLVFFENDNVRQLCRDEMHDFALAEDGKESGAENHRFDVEPIDRSRGS
ncbi:MAG: replication endonuclease, partial [Methylococcales bacterium]